MEQILANIPVPRGGGLHGPVSAASSSHSPGAVDDAFTGFFALFPKVKKVRGWVRTRGRNWVQTLIHGLRRLVATPWRSRTTSRSQGRSPRLRWRRMQRLVLELAFGRYGSACGSWSYTWVGQYGCVPIVIGAPSHTHGLSFTRKLQPMSMNSPRTYLTEAVVAASGPEGRRGAGRERGAEAAVQFDGVVAIPDTRDRWLTVPFSLFIDGEMDIPVVRAALVLAVYNCAEDRGDSCGVPVLFNDKFQQSRIRVEGASDSVHPLHAGLSCCATETRSQCKLYRRPQRSHRCVCSSW